MDDILKRLSERKMGLEEAKEELMRRFLVTGVSKLDFGRTERTGVPEIVLGEGKGAKQIASICKSFLEVCGRAMVSRLEPERVEEVLYGLSGVHREHVYDRDARLLILRGEKFEHPVRGGKVGFITAGTSDIPIAREGEMIAAELGCEVMAYYDVGVAGPYRIVSPLQELSEWGADVIVVAAGREGALPTVVSGLVPVPVIGLPVSTGYGLHGNGETALFAMLQSCSPLLVVNIDAGIIAGAMASKIARQKI